MTCLILIFTIIIVGVFLVSMIRDEEKKLRGWWNPRDGRGGQLFVLRKTSWRRVEYIDKTGIGTAKISWVRRYYWKSQ
jgi:hypothetical protein